MNGWTGRTDTDGGLRWHQVVGDPCPGRNVRFVGLCSDEGVRRNQGRVGAAQGPAALRRALANLPEVQGVALTDAGDVTCVGNGLEQAQDAYADLVATSVRDGSLPVGLGGGHEVAWASFQGLMRSRTVAQDEVVGILNFDAHFDMRPAGEPTSGNSFSLALQASRPRYLVLGISEAANTAPLFDAASLAEVEWRTDDQLTATDLTKRSEDLTRWLNGVDHLYLTVCLDVLPGHVAPGVSAPAARGVPLDVIEPLLALAASSGKLRVADFAELNPRYDQDDRTARTAARLVWRLVRSWAAS